MTLEYQVKTVRNPYSETIPDAEFAALLDGVISARAQSIEARHAAGEYERDRMSFTILDPTAASGARAEDIVLAIATIGPEGDFFAPNAVAKAFARRDNGADATATLAIENHRVPDGAFRFGGSADVAGTIVGGSGQTPLQDSYESTLLAADFNYRVAMARANWEEASGWGRWYADEQAPKSRYSTIIEQTLQS